MKIQVKEEYNNIPTEQWLQSKNDLKRHTAPLENGGMDDFLAGTQNEGMDV